MEHHGEIPKQNVIAIVPARYASTRLPGKLLLELAGVPLIVHTLRRASEARHVTRVLAAVDDERLFAAVRREGFEAIMTSPDHNSGSDRIAEVAASLPAGSIIVNVQGDEPTISPETVDRAVTAMFEGPSCEMVTVFEVITNANDVIDPNTVKVVIDNGGYALYFSRSPIPFPRSDKDWAGGLEQALITQQGVLDRYKKHTGLYVYKREFLLEFSKMEPSPLEKVEKLEQLRALENGARIRVVEAAATSIGVDTASDFERVRRILEDEDGGT